MILAAADLENRGSTFHPQKFDAIGIYCAYARLGNPGNILGRHINRGSRIGRNGDVHCHLVILPLPIADYQSPHGIVAAVHPIKCLWHLWPNEDAVETDGVGRGLNAA